MKAIVFLADGFEEIEALLEHDKPEGNGLDELDGIIELDYPTNALKLTKENYKK